MYAVIPTGSGGQDEGLQVPHVALLGAKGSARPLYEVHGSLFGGAKVGYVRATSDQPQLWHRDLLLELQNLGVQHAFSCLKPVNLDGPMDGCENMFVYVSGSSVPYLWQKVSMSMVAGDPRILGSYVIHCGGAVQREALAKSTCVIAFAAITRRLVDYETTLPIIPPPWVEAPAQQPSPPSPKAVPGIAARCHRLGKADLPPKCFACNDSPLCAIHVGQLCADCQRDFGEDAPTVDDAPAEMDAEGAEEFDGATQKIVEEDLCGFAAVVIMRLDQTVLYPTNRPGPLAAEIAARLVIDASAPPCAPEDCPPGPFVHEQKELPAPNPSKFHVIATQPGSPMVVREGRWLGRGWWRTTWAPPSPKACDGMWQAATRGSLTRLSWSNRGFWWPTLSAPRNSGPCKQVYTYMCM